MIGTSDQSCWLDEACKILSFFLGPLPAKRKQVKVCDVTVLCSCESLQVPNPHQHFIRQRIYVKLW